MQQNLDLLDLRSCRSLLYQRIREERWRGGRSREERRGNRVIVVHKESRREERNRRDKEEIRREERRARGE